MFKNLKTRGLKDQTQSFLISASCDREQIWTLTKLLDSLSAELSPIIKVVIHTVDYVLATLSMARNCHLFISKLAQMPLRISPSQSTLRNFPSMDFSAFPKLEAEITFDFTIQLQNLPFYGVELNLSPFKCFRPRSDWTSFGYPQEENKEGST